MYAYPLAEKARVRSENRFPNPDFESRDFFYRRQLNCLAITLRSLGSLTLNGPSFASIPLQSINNIPSHLLSLLPSPSLFVKGGEVLAWPLMHSCWRDALIKSKVTHRSTVLLLLYFD